MQRCLLTPFPVTMVVEFLTSKLQDIRDKNEYDFSEFQWLLPGMTASDHLRCKHPHPPKCSSVMKKNSLGIVRGGLSIGLAALRQ